MLTVSSPPTGIELTPAGPRLGSYTLDNPWILAPMAGVSEMPFRLIARRLGAAAAPTELVSCKGLLYGQERTRRYLDHDDSEDPFWVQIFGGEPESMAVGAERAKALGAQIIDVNMGCPVKKVTRHGAGSALMTDPDRAAAVVRGISERTGLPVTVKLRSGWDDRSVNALEVAQAVVEAGSVAVAIHGRTRQQGYSGQADWQIIADLVDHLDVPVIGNGDALTPRAALAMRLETGCAAVMIGRGALGNPWIFSRLRDGGGPPDGPARWPVFYEHLSAHVAHTGDERRAVRRFRPQLGWYARGLDGAATFRRDVLALEGLAEVFRAAERFFRAASLARGEEAGELDPQETGLGAALG